VGVRRGDDQGSGGGGGDGLALRSTAWAEVGFQQRDPASDFRGGGLLGLHQLVYFARTRGDAAREMLVTPSAEAARYPWACAGINVTMTAAGVLGDGTLDGVLLTVAEQGRDVVAAYHDVYCDLFEKLHARWVAADPENVLAFGPVFDAAMKDAVRELKTGRRVVVAEAAGPAEGVGGKRA
jgi:hypothetical protein